LSIAKFAAPAPHTPFAHAAGEHARENRRDNFVKSIRQGHCRVIRADQTLSATGL
jgi:hypothetical protein